MSPLLLEMRMIKSILRQRLCSGDSLERCAQSHHVSKGVVAKYAALAQAAGLDCQSLQSLDEAQLQQRLLPAHAPGQSLVLPDFELIHRELSRKGVTKMPLWQEYQADHLGERTLQYSQFCERYLRYAKTLKRSMRQVHRAGEKLFVDFAGPTLALADGTRANLFVAALGASKYTYACATAAQKTLDWITGMTGALHFIGGVPEVIVPDNPRAVIAQPDRYEPRVGDTVRDFAAHYGCAVLPARPHTPQDKAIVESAVQVGVPHALVGQGLDARITADTVTLLHRGQRVAAHVKSAQVGGFTTVDEHMPAAHRAHRQWTPQRLIDWGLGIGTSTGAFVEQLLHRYKHPEHGYRSALGLLALDKRYGRPRLEAACALALSLHAYHYRTVRDILTNGRDQEPVTAPTEWQSPHHANVRGATVYH